MAASTTTNDTERLARLDFDHVWHPFTAMRQWRDATPTIIERGDGFELIDTDGRRYIDGFSSLWCNVHGHRVPEIDAAIRDQLDRIAHSTMLGLASVPAIELASDLARIAPGVMSSERGGRTRVFYSDAGATATELAFKMAFGRHHHRGEGERDTFIGVSGAYHGDTVGAMSIGYSEPFHTPYRKLTFGCAWTPAPDVAHPDPLFDLPPVDPGAWPSRDEARRRMCVEAALEALDRRLDEIGDRCAGLVIEPLMQGAAGMIEQPEGYLHGVAQRARARGIPLIADEVATGFGRTGAMFACDVENVTPDILCVAKGLSGGYLPLAATLCSEEIASAFEGEPGEHRTLYHGHTFTGNPLACAAARASLALFETGAVLENVRSMSSLMRDRVTALSDHPHIGDVRQRGIMMGLEVVADRGSMRPFPQGDGVPQAVCMAARAAGLMIRPLGNVVILMPAPAMDLETLDRMMTILVRAIDGFDFKGVI